LSDCQTCLNGRLPIYRGLFCCFWTSLKEVNLFDFKSFLIAENDHPLLFRPLASALTYLGEHTLRNEPESQYIFLLNRLFAYSDLCLPHPEQNTKGCCHWCRNRRDSGWFYRQICR